MLAGHVDLDELVGSVRVGSVGAEQIFRTRRDSQECNPGLDLVLRFDSTLIELTDGTPHSYACIGRYALPQPPPRTTLLWRR
jgi:hypothetical protein